MVRATTVLLMCVTAAGTARAQSGDASAPATHAPANTGSPSSRVFSELTVGRVDLFPGLWMTTLALTGEVRMTRSVWVFGTVPVAATVSRVDGGFGPGNLTLGARGTVRRQRSHGGITEVRLEGSVSSATASTDGDSRSTAALAERFHRGHALGLWQPDTTTARAKAGVHHERARLFFEASLAAAVALHDIRALAPDGVSALVFAEIRGGASVGGSVDLWASVTNVIVVEGGGDERFTHTAQFGVTRDWGSWRSGSGVYAPLDSSFRDAGIWGVTVSVEVVR